jgi:hypothetical protein
MRKLKLNLYLNDNTGPPMGVFAQTAANRMTGGQTITDLHLSLDTMGVSNETEIVEVLVAFAVVPSLRSLVMHGRLMSHVSLLKLSEWMYQHRERLQHIRTLDVSSHEKHTYSILPWAMGH